MDIEGLIMKKVQKYCNSENRSPLEHYYYERGLRKKVELKGEIGRNTPEYYFYNDELKNRYPPTYDDYKKAKRAFFDGFCDTSF